MKPICTFFLLFISLGMAAQSNLVEFPYNPDANGNGICDDEEVAGCTYASACNYDQAATIDDGSCEMPVPGYDCDGNPIDPSDGTPGCTYPNAENYNPLATVDDGSCTLSGGSNLCPSDLDGDGITATEDLLLFLGAFGYPCTNEGCTDPDYLEYDASATSDDGSCQTLIVLGCTNPDYLEYDAAATIDNGACVTVRISGCTDESFFEYSALANDDDGSCVTEIVPGCTYPEFSNYDPSANVDDGGCAGLIISGCADPEACNYNALATVDDGSCLVVCFECETVLLEDDFNGYDAAIPLSIQSSDWTTWSGIPGSAEDPFVVFDGSDGAVLLQLPNDLVLPIGAVSGRYMVQYSVVPGTSFYMNVQGSLSTGVEWTLEQLAFPNGDWYVQSLLSGDSVFIPGYTPGEEMLQTFIFDLDADVVEMYLGPELVVSAGYPGNLGSINFYPASFDGFDANAAYFVDDVKVCSATTLQYGCTNALYGEYDPQADLEDGSCSTLVVGCSDPSAANYVATVTTDNGSCIYPVTFQVDLSNYPDSLGQVFLNGSWLGWCGSCAPMSDPDGDGVFALTINVPEGVNEYIFTMNGWSIVEEVYLQPACAGDPNGDGYFNRVIDVLGTEILSPVCWGECSPCAGAE